MQSWVRYCVTVYIGLLISGALARPPWTYRAPGDPVPIPGQQGTATPSPQSPKADPGHGSQNAQPKKLTSRPGASATLTG